MGHDDGHLPAVRAQEGAGVQPGIRQGEAETVVVTAEEQAFLILVFQRIDLLQISLIDGRVGDDAPAAEDFDVVPLAVEDRVVHVPDRVHVVAEAAVREDEFREGIAEEIDPAVGTVVGGITVGIVAILGEGVHRTRHIQKPGEEDAEADGDVADGLGVAYEAAHDQHHAQNQGNGREANVRWSYSPSQVPWPVNLYRSRISEPVLSWRQTFGPIPLR